MVSGRLQDVSEPCLMMMRRHGPITPCLITHSEKLLEEYLRYDEGSEERMKVEQRYGKRNIERLLKAHEEQKLNEEWLKSSTTNCPGCNVHVEKSLGCNHVGESLTRCDE